MLPELTTTALEALYSKETSKLALLAQKLQVSKQKDRILQKTAEAGGDINIRMGVLKIDVEALSTEHLALKSAFDKGDADWKAKLAMVEKLLCSARQSDDPAVLITAVKQEIELVSSRPSLLSTQLAAIERLSALKMKEKEKSELAEAIDLIAAMNTELSILESVVERGQKELHIECSEEEQNQEILQLKAQLGHEIAAKNDAIKKLRENLPLIEAGTAIRRRKLEWCIEGAKQDVKLLDMGDKASHYGAALADAYLLVNCTESSDRIPVYVTLYAFHPALVLSFGKCTKFVEILDWRAAVSNFHRGCLASTKFETLFLQAMRPSPVGPRLKLTSYATPLSSVTEQVLTAYFETNETAMKSYKQMKDEYEVGLANHKQAMKRR